MSNQAVDDALGVTHEGHVAQVLAIVRTVLDRPGLGPDDDVMDHGGTSLSIVRILAETRSSLGLDINPRDLNGIVSARSLVRAAR